MDCCSVENSVSFFTFWSKSSLVVWVDFRNVCSQVVFSILCTENCDKHVTEACWTICFALFFPQQIRKLKHGLFPSHNVMYSGQIVRGHVLLIFLWLTSLPPPYSFHSCHYPAAVYCLFINSTCCSRCAQIGIYCHYNFDQNQQYLLMFSCLSRKSVLCRTPSLGFI